MTVTPAPTDLPPVIATRTVEVCGVKVIAELRHHARADGDWTVMVIIPTLTDDRARTYMVHTRERGSLETPFRWIDDALAGDDEAWTTIAQWGYRRLVH